jgi:hypothetical protein
MKTIRSIKPLYRPRHKFRLKSKRLLFLLKSIVWSEVRKMTLIYMQ